MNSFLDTSDPEVDSRFVLPNIRGQLQTLSLTDLQPGTPDVAVRLRNHVESVCELTQMLLSKFTFDQSWHKCAELLSKDLDVKWTAINRNTAYPQREKVLIAVEMLRGQLIACAWSANCCEVKPELKTKAVQLMNLIQMTWDVLNLGVATDALKEFKIDQLLLQLLQLHGSSNLIKLYRSICEETDWSEIAKVVTQWKYKGDGNAASTTKVNPAIKPATKPQVAAPKTIIEAPKSVPCEVKAVEFSVKPMDTEALPVKSIRFPFGQSRDSSNRAMTLEKVVMANKAPAPAEDKEQVLDRRDELMNMLRQNQEKENKQRLNKQVVGIKAAKTQELESRPLVGKAAAAGDQPVLSRMNSFAQPTLQRMRSLKLSASTLVVRGRKPDAKKPSSDPSKNDWHTDELEDLFETSAAFEGESVPASSGVIRDFDGFAGNTAASHPGDIKPTDKTMQQHTLAVGNNNREPPQEDQLVVVPPRKRRMSSISRDHWGDDIVALGTPKNEKNSVQVSAAKSSQTRRKNEAAIPLEQPLITKRVLNFDF